MKQYRFRNHAAVFLALGMLLAAAGCGEADSSVSGDTSAGVDVSGGDTNIVDDTSGGTDASVGEDTTDTGGGGLDTTPDTEADSSTDAGGGDPDTDDADTGNDNCPGGAYCECTSNSDCDQGFCISGPTGNICAEVCIEGCTQDGFDCKLVNFPGNPDPVNLCVPKGGNICNPCKASSECSSLGDGTAACVDNGDAGAFCGSTCTTDASCAVGYTCKDVTSIEGTDVKQCVPKDNGICACSDAAIAKELATVCYTGSGDAKCEGVRTCLADGKQGAPAGGGLSACLAPDPKQEACNAIDDDCDGETDESTCNDDNPCTEDTCDGQNGCKTTNKAGACDADGSACTKDDACKDGKCVAGAAVECDDGNPCTADSCDQEKGCVYVNDDGKGCNADDNACTQNDACKDGKCEPGETKACASEDQCVTGKCNIIDGVCKYTFQEGQGCNDGNPCTTGEKCQTDNCTGKPTECDDLNPCTADSCDKSKGCIHTNVPGPCTDGNECTEQDSCDEGKCKGKITDETVKCNDNNDCTKDTCDPIKGCQNAPQTGSSCDDANGCTVGDSCDGGVCKSGTNTCSCTADSDCTANDDGNLCNGTLFCDKSALPYQCKVNPATIVKCDTSKDTFCAQTQCTPSTGKCDVVKKPEGTSCDADQSLCTTDDQCKDGVCTPGAKLACDDKNPCTDDVCDPKDGCKFIANTAPCDADGNACTENDVCLEKSCTAGKAKVCDDGEFCTEDSCDPSDGSCKTKNLSKSCDDGNACTEGDKCGDVAGKWSCVAGVGPDCDDKNPCTKDTCDKTNGCTNTNDDTATVPCYSGDPATKGKGICTEGVQKCSAGKLGSCEGEVLPLKEETCGNSKDDTCNGQTDEGCKPTSYEARFGSAVVTGKVKSGNAEYDARMLVGGSATGGESKGTKNTARFGFYEWVSSLLGGK
ncbi:MAG: extracellular matrix protein [Pseudomonadota bacterium]